MTRAPAVGTQQANAEALGILRLAVYPRAQAYTSR